MPTIRLARADCRYGLKVIWDLDASRSAGKASVHAGVVPPRRVADAQQVEAVLQLTVTFIMLLSECCQW